MPDAFFLTGASAPLFTLYWPGLRSRAPVILLPPLLEEMNRTRRQLHDIAEALASQGLPVLCCDVAGTGDSGSELEAVRWSDWQHDIRVCRQWLASRHQPAPRFCAVRGGALLLAGHDDCDWLAVAPMQNGEQQLQQWLRLRKLAARMAGETLSDAELDTQLKGPGLEVAGYWLAPALTEGLVTAVLPVSLPKSSSAISPAMSPTAAQRVLLDWGVAEQPAPAWQKYLSAGWQWQNVAGERCWDSTETTSNAQLTATIVAQLLAMETR